MLWKSETVLFDGDAYFASLFAEWARAERTIDFETYIFENDALSAEVTKVLLAARNRGVRVRLLVDGIGASGWWQTKGVELEKLGLDVRVYHPLVIPELWRKLMIDMRLIEPLRRPKRSLVLRRLNRRNHRKVSIVDGQVAYVGSVNVSQVHSKRLSGDNAWRDTCVRLEGPGVTELRHAFEHAWARSQSVLRLRPLKIKLSLFKRSALTESPVGLNYTRRLRRTSQKKFARQIETCRTRIWISNAYLAPPSNVVRRLVLAARRGVDVRILVPERSDVWFMPLIARAYYRSLIKGGVHIFEYQPRFLHAKSMILDNAAIIGSSNLNRRSFLHDLEVDVLIDNPAAINVLVDQFQIDQSQSLEVTKRGTVVGSRLGRLLNYLFRYWV